MPIESTLATLPYEVKSEIYNHVSVEDLARWLKVAQLRDSITSFLLELASRQRRSAVYFPLKDVMGPLDYELLAPPRDGIDRQMPHLKQWSDRQPIAWLISSIQILAKANSLDGDFTFSELNSHTPMLSPRINTNFVMYVRNAQVGLWRRETQSGVYIEPHGPHPSRSMNNSWLCRSEIELFSEEQIFATGISQLSTTTGQWDGSVNIKVFSTISLKTLADFESGFLCPNPSLQIHAINKFWHKGKPVITVLISVWDRRWANGYEESDMKQETYYVADSLSNSFEKVETLGHNDAQRHKVYLMNTVYYRVTLSGAHDFGSELAIQCSSKHFSEVDSRSIFRKRLFSSPTDFGFHPKLNILWLYDKFQLLCYSPRDGKCILKYDLRCKSKVASHTTERGLFFSMVNSITNTITLQQLVHQNGSVEVCSRDFDIDTNYTRAVFHDSAILLHSEDQCSIQIHDYLRPLLS